MAVGKRAREDAVDAKLDVVVVCCGQPKLSMGWFHLTQLLEEPNVNVRAIVEPFFLGAGKDTPGAKAFAEMRKTLEESHPALAFCASADDVPSSPRPAAGEARKPMLALIAGRTCECAAQGPPNRPRGTRDALAHSYLALRRRARRAHSRRTSSLVCRRAPAARAALRRSSRR